MPTWVQTLLSCLGILGVLLAVFGILIYLGARGRA